MTKKAIEVEELTDDRDRSTGPNSSRRFSELVRTANKFVLKRPNLKILRPHPNAEHTVLSTVLQDAILTSDRIGRLVLPDLRVYNNQTVVVLTDYGGEHNQSKYLTYSALLCPMSCCGGFAPAMRRVRRIHGLGSKEIAFKDFRMGQLRRALPDYLALLDMTPGFLLTLVVDKRVESLFELGGGPRPSKRVSTLLEAHGYGRRKPKVAEKLMRVADTIAFLTALLAHNGQKVFWMTDNDSIVQSQGSSSPHDDTLMLFQTLLEVYKRPGFNFSLVGGASPFDDDGNEMFADLLSATDITAGSLAQFMTLKLTDPAGHQSVKPGCDDVLMWLTKDGIGLKKMTIVIRPDESGPIGAFKSSIFELLLKKLPEDALMIPVYV